MLVIDPLELDRLIERFMRLSSRFQRALRTSDANEHAFELRPRQFDDELAGRTASSWRAMLLLEGGRYRFQGRVRTEIEQRPVSAEAVSLRSSEGRESRRQPPTNGWAVVEHEFTLTGRDYVSLIYEYGAVEGFAALDKDSLKLIRLGGPPGATRPKPPAK